MCMHTHKEYQAEGFFDVESPCATCFPGVHPYYAAAHTVYVECCDQVIMGFGGAISLNLIAIDLIMTWFNVADEDKLELSSDVRRIFALVSKEERRIQKQKEAAKKKK